jgi:Flp pilus assembly protein TadD
MMEMRRRGLQTVVVAALVLAVAASAAAAKSAKFRVGLEQWRKGVVAAGVDPGDAVYPFTTSPEMESWVAGFNERYGRMAPTERLAKLQQLLFDSTEFPFTYEQPLTLTAADAFAQRRGNCMAFTVMFVALARAMGIECCLVAVTRAPEIEKEDDLVVVNRHVVAGYVHANAIYLFDFYVNTRSPYMSHRVIDDVKACAMFHTNLGGSAIRDGDLELARFHLELASRLDPQLASAWVNLGVVRSRTGDPYGALAAYENALRVAPEQPSALTNMAYVHQQLGQADEARAALRAAAEGVASPFALIALADVEVARGNLDLARGYLFRARRAFGKTPEVYDALARLARREDDLLSAARYQKRAEKLRQEAQGRTSGAGGSASN